MSLRGNETKPQVGSVRSTPPQAASKSTAPQDTTVTDGTGHTASQSAGSNNKYMDPQTSESDTTASTDTHGSGVINKLIKEQVEEFKEVHVFDLFDRTGDGNIRTKELGKVVRSLGYIPTETELSDMINEIGAEELGQINFNEFLSLMARKLYRNDTEYECMDAFKAVDRNGYDLISKDELKHVIATLGENITDYEMEAMLKEAGLDGDNGNSYDGFVKILLPD